MLLYGLFITMILCHEQTFGNQGVKPLDYLDYLK